MDRTLVIEGMDPTTIARLEAAARDRGVDPTTLARSLLEQSIESIPCASHELDALAGTWSDDEAKAFEKATAAMRSVDPKSWR
jgi:hypothetical protein